MLSGIRDGAVIKRLPGEARVMLPLQTSGGEGRRWWFINGEPLEAAGARTTLMLDKPGEWQLVVMDEAGQTAAASFTLHNQVNLLLAVCVFNTHLILTKCYLHP